MCLGSQITNSGLAHDYYHLRARFHHSHWRQPSTERSPVSCRTLCWKLPHVLQRSWQPYRRGITHISETTKQTYKQWTALPKVSQLICLHYWVTFVNTRLIFVITRKVSVGAQSMLNMLYFFPSISKWSFYTVITQYSIIFLLHLVTSRNGKRFINL